MRILLTIALAATLAGGCSALAGTAPAPTPRPCDETFTAARCSVIADMLAAEAGVGRTDVVALEVMPGPTPEVRDGVVILQMTSGGSNPDVRVTFADGSTEIVTLYCGGIASGSIPWCMDEPTLGAGPHDALVGYHDRPEGATPVPTVAADAAADARGLRLDRLDIAIDSIGLHEVRLGDARVPNGRLSRATFTLVDDWPDDVTILDGVRLEIRAQDGTVIGNVYEHGWRAGTERVEAFLLFDVARFEPGASLRIRDVVVE